MQNIQLAMKTVCDTLFDPNVLDEARIKPGAFTRNNGKLSYVRMMEILMKKSTNTISSSMDSFFTKMRLAAGESISSTIQCSQQAFSKARAGIDHTIFKKCNDQLVESLYNEASSPWANRYPGDFGDSVFAIDGSTAPLPSRKALLDEFGGLGKDANSPTARISGCLDTQNNILVDALIAPISTGERELAIRHIENLINSNRIDPKYSLFVFDRGYASEELISYIEDVFHTQYLFRLKSKFNAEIDALPAPEKGEISEYIIDFKGRKIRVIKFYLESGCLETLITNNFEIDKSRFVELYFKRWPVEGEFDLLKNRVNLNCFRGYSVNSIMQEFWISILLANLTTIIGNEADGIIDYEVNTGENKHNYKSNTNEGVGTVCEHIDEYIEVYYNSDEDTSSKEYEVVRYILGKFINKRVVDKKGLGESNPRRIPRAVKNHYNRRTTH